MSADIDCILADLNTILEELISSEDQDEVLYEEDIKWIAENLSDFCHKAISKFIKGQIQHGGKIIDKDLDVEIDQEHIDLFWYLAASKRKRQNEKK